MTETRKKSSHLTTRLDVSRETEILRSYVWTDTSQDDEDNNLYGSSQIKFDDRAITGTSGKVRDLIEAKFRPVNIDSGGKGNENEVSTKTVGKKKKRRGHRQEELYTDKDRAAAVNMGTRDIKQSLKLKRQQDRTKALQIPEESDSGTFLALGNYEMAKRDLGIALEFMNKALELNPREKNALVARSKCYIFLGQPENGLKDAEAALAIDKVFLKGVYQKAEALYYLGDFEKSLMYFHRGLHLRPDHEGFKLGADKARKAIENAIGTGVFQGNAIVKGVLSSYRNGSNQRSKSATPSPNFQSEKRYNIKDLLDTELQKLTES